MAGAGRQGHRIRELSVSAIASFYRLARADVADFVRAAGDDSSAWEFLQRRARSLDEPEELFSWSGYVLLYLMLYLAENGAELGEAELVDETAAISETYDETFLITSADQVHLPALDPDRFDARSLAEFFDEAGYGFDELPLAAEEGLRILHDQIAALAADQILVIHIG
jgi:hypothetical protein